jgi:tetratricopeptide (TPR) repeat protein
MKGKLQAIMKKLTAILLILNLAGAYLGAQDPYLSGIARLEEGDLQAAMTLFTTAIKTKGANPDLLLKLAETHYSSGAYQQAIEYAKEANRMESGKGNYMLARSFAISGQVSPAVQYLEKHLKSRFKRPRHEILLDTAFASIEETAAWKALWKQTWYSEAENLEFEVAYFRRSAEYIAALEKIVEGLSENPRWDELYAEKGHILFLMGNYQDAVRAYSQAIEISATAAYYQGRAEAFIQQEKYTEGIKDLERTLRLQPEKLSLYKRLSLLNQSAGNYPEATENILQYLEYFPAIAEVHFICGEIYFDDRDYLKALDCFNRCLALDKDEARYFEARGKTYLNTGTHAYALKDFTMALDLDPYNPRIWYMKGLCRLRLKDKEGAHSDLEKATRYGSVEARQLLEEMMD